MILRRIEDAASGGSLNGEESNKIIFSNTGGESEGVGTSPMYLVITLVLDLRGKRHPDAVASNKNNHMGGGILSLREDDFVLEAVDSIY